MSYCLVDVSAIVHREVRPLPDRNFPEWTFERKLDGIRAIAFKQGDAVRLLSRNQLSLTESYFAVAQAIARLPVDQVILDGEASGAWGRQGSADYHVFDVLWWNDRSVTALTLDERWTLLDRLPFDSPLVRVLPVEGDAP
ncbi:MAG: hypothetical protein ABR606_05660 [Vicinamibacterales bacterium]